MIELNGVVSLISERGLRLIRTADSLRVVGDCPPELAEAIRQHSAALIPFAAIDPDSAEQVAEQQAEANSTTSGNSWKPSLSGLSSTTDGHHVTTLTGTLTASWFRLRTHNSLNG